MAQLMLDAAAVEAIRALAAANVRAILLKGPAIARWLYEWPYERGYWDIDLLVAPDQSEAAALALAELGYANRHGGLRAEDLPGHAYHWARGGSRRSEIDLHHRLFWVRGHAGEAWRELSANTEILELGDARVEILGVTARVMLVAMHAAEHGARSNKPIRDLALALERVAEPEWRRASALAGRLGAGEAFASGLALLPAGADLAERLRLHQRASVEMRLHAETMQPTVLGLKWMLESRSWRSRAQRLWRELLPPPEFIRVWRPLARRGPGGLAAAYVWRPLWLMWKAPAALRQLLRVRRDAGAVEVSPRTLHAAWWAWRATGRARRQLRQRGLDGVRLPRAPRTDAATQRAVMAVLRRRGASCLEASLVRQKMFEAMGDRRELVIGVVPPGRGFRAHAWLEGDEEDDQLLTLVRRDARAP